MNPIFSYITPPLLGAFIGYMTNYVAIRMLFRPLSAWRILGLRIPMTPGVIPVKRHDLAKNIGEMVGAHLLTSSDVKRALTEEGFQFELELLIQDRTEEVLNKELGPLPTLIPSRFRSYFDAGIKILRWRALKHLHKHIAGEEFAQNISTAIESGLDDFLAQDLDTLLPAKSRQDLVHSLEKIITRFLSNPELEAWIKNNIQQKTVEFLSEDKSCNDLFPQEILQSLLDRFEAEAPHLLQQLAVLLEKPVVQKKIAQSVSKAVQPLIGILGPLAESFNRAASGETLEQKITRYLSGKGKKITQWLFDESVQQKTAEILRAKADDLLATPLAVLLQKVPASRIELAGEWAGDRIVSLLRNPATSAKLSDLIKDGLESQTNKTAKEFLQDIFDQDGSVHAKSWAASNILAAIRSVKAKKIMDNMVIELVEKKLLAQPVGKLNELLPKDVQSGMSGYLLQQISDLLVREVPGLVDTLNIKEIVAKKVDSLDLLRLERLLLGIMEEQFKYINLFGAFLGFLIGLLNILFLGTFHN